MGPLGYKFTMLFKIKLKRVLSIIATFAFFSVLPSPLPLNSFASETFSDVLSAHPNFEAINYVQAQNIVSGYPDGTFRPNDLINRAEFTKIIVETYYQGQATGSDCFPDVGKEWFAQYVCFAKSDNFLSGYPDGTFKPANDVNFVESAKILINVKGLDVTPDPIAWYIPYAKKLSELHAIPPSITTFDHKVTRGEMAEMVYRLKADVKDLPVKPLEDLVLEQLKIGLPMRLKIPSINVDSSFEYVGLTHEGAVGAPQNPINAAWFDVGPRPGDIGNSIITGHINWYNGVTGVFADLDQLKPGDKITVLDDKGAVITFVVRGSQIYDATAEVVNVFSSSDGKAHLNLITCDGVWVKSAQQYSERLVIFTDRE